MADFGWTREALALFDAHLREDSREIAEARELQAAGVSPATIASLYPLEPLAYRAGFQALCSDAAATQRLLACFGSVDAYGMAARFVPKGVPGDDYLGGRGLLLTVSAIADQFVPFHDAVAQFSKFNERARFTNQLAGVFTLPRLLSHLSVDGAAWQTASGWSNTRFALDPLCAAVKHLSGLILEHAASESPPKRAAVVG